MYNAQSHLYGQDSTPSFSTRSQISSNLTKTYQPAIRNWLDVNFEHWPDDTKSVIYNKNDQIGSGNYGTVFKTYDNRAFKTLSSRGFSDEMAWTKFLKEYKLWKYIDEKNWDKKKNKPVSNYIARVYELRDFHFPAYPFTMIGIVTELYKCDLESHIKKLEADNKYDKKTILTMMNDICKGATALHFYKIIHGDIAKRNFLVDKKGRIVITDFGLSHKIDKLDSSGSTSSTKNDLWDTQNQPETYGTYYEDENPQAQPFWWCAPEIIDDMINRRPLKYSVKTDAYMVGCTFAELMIDIEAYKSVYNFQGRSYIPFSIDTKNRKDLMQFGNFKRMEEVMALKRRSNLELKVERSFREKKTRKNPKTFQNFSIIGLLQITLAVRTYTHATNIR